jgi:hypothetical protein
MKSRSILLATALLLVALAGCRTAPIYNPSGVPLTPPPNATQQQIGNAIKHAGSRLGWTMTDQGPGEILAVLQERNRRAEVLISYDKSSFSINYRDSANLKVDGDTIHKRYNAWVEKLEATIQKQVRAGG